MSYIAAKTHSTSSKPALRDRHHPVTSRASEGRRELMDRITTCVLDHDVAITGSNLAVIAAGLSGSDRRLAQAFVAREIAQAPVTQKWLDELGAGADRRSGLEELMDRIELSLDAFAKTAKSAQHETSEQRGAIDAQIARMASIGADTAPDIEIERLTSLSRAMLRRLSQVETAMKRSEAESDELRARLARARLDAELDHLTQLPNRRAFEREFRGAVEESAARGTRLSVGFCDVDHFKAINDTHGHDAGDRVLIAIARSLERHLGDNCFAARHGGEEFAVLFRGLGLQEARQHLDAVRAAQSARRMINRETGNGFGKITFSAGIAEVAGPDDARDALARADRALYQAKDGGRDRIAIL